MGVVSLLIVSGCAKHNDPKLLPTAQAKALSKGEQIKLDGNFNEPVWRRAKPLRPCVDTMGGRRLKWPAMHVRMAYDDQALYIAAEVYDSRLIAPHTHQDDHLWENDVLELMIDPLGTEHNYVELQVSPRGIVFDSRFDSRRQPAPFGRLHWSSGMRVAVKTQGRVDDNRDDRGYKVELALPWENLVWGQKAPATFRHFLQKGLRANIYVLDRRPEGAASVQGACGWSAVLVPDFHFPKRFGYIVADGPKQLR